MPPAGARIRVIRGRDACSVARAVRDAVGDGILLPAGPYRYPYAAMLQLLRIAGLFQDPAGDTTTDPVLTREALADMLRRLLPLGVSIGLLRADAIDHASAKLFADFAQTARFAVGQGFRASGLVLGATGDLPPVLRLPDAELREAPGRAAPLPHLSPQAGKLLSLLQQAPHPVQEESLLQACGLAPGVMRGALRELAAAELAELGTRVALGPAADPESAAPADAWLQTPEVRLPQARLAINRDLLLARHLGHEALRHGEPAVAAHCFALAGGGAPADQLAFAQALAADGAPGQARTVYDQLLHSQLTSGNLLQLGVLAAMLAERGHAPEDEANRLLRQAERAGFGPAARSWRARLLLAKREFAAARNLLRRTRKAELEQCAPEQRLEHAIAEARALQGLGQQTGAARCLQQATGLCTTRAQRRRVAELAGGTKAEQLAAQDLDARALAAAEPSAARAALLPLFESASRPHALREDSLPALFRRLSEHGASLLAALVGESLELHPPGAQAVPGLAARLEARLRTLRAFPHAVSVDRDELAALGPFSGQSVLVLRSHGQAGPLIVVFRGGSLPALEALLGKEFP